MKSFYSYSQMIFFISLGLLFLFLVMTFVKCVPLLKTLSSLAPKLATLNNTLGTFKERKTQVSQILSPLIKKLKTFSWAVLLLKAATVLYKEDDSAKGLKGYGKSAIRAYQNEKSVEKAFRRYLKKNPLK